MTQPSRDQYLESKVLTASQPQLHIMLLDKAVHVGSKAKEMWAAETDYLEIDPVLAQMTEVVEALVHSLAAGTADVSKQLEEQYAFVYRELISCRINESQESLENCLKVLSFQRETWKLALEQEAAVPAPKMAMPKLTVDTAQVSAGISFEA